MSPDDPRHGTIAGCSAHLRTKTPACDACKRAKMRYEKQRLLAGGATKVAAHGTRRRIQALRALGYSLRELAEVGGWGSAHAAFKYPLIANTITAETARRVLKVYNRLSMTPASGPRVGRNLRLARRNGWAPPLAWEGIDMDDPTAEPWRPDSRRRVGRLDVVHARVEDFDWLVSQGESEEQAAVRLGVRLDTLRDQRRRLDGQAVA
ncbi:hypothetical protein [Pimelobacter simplex]|uniref:hypothetical protein n=1 Tax=Nocardioides simplex TaxID=2045 RepID=UPI001145136D|nr:hypothetical protein [Pimelobacter simplex]GEB16696.1 hypothetical protein NSI01_50110 [Pimelobacter simplex]